VAEQRLQDEKEVPLPNAGSGAAAIAAQLRRAILEGVYGHRERLPAERELAVHFSASRSTVREALKRLEENQLVVRRIGSGTFVNYRAGEDNEDIAERTSPLELIEVRLAVEPHMARLAALHGTQRDLERLRDALKQVEACKRDAEAFSRADALFHQVLAECSRNPLMLWLYRQINDVRNHAQWNRMKDKILSPERLAEYNRQHRSLFDAIWSRDADGAARAVGEHLDKARRDLLGAGRE
jgi:GntR family uxuAB operon transcriptional repressor